MTNWRVTLQRTIGWCVVLLGIFMGIVIIAVVGGLSDGAVPKMFFKASVAGIVPIASSLIAIRNTRRASRLYLWMSPLVFLFGFGSIFDLLFGFGYAFHFPGTIIASAALLLPGLFWYFASRKQWPPLSIKLLPQSKPLSLLAAGAISSCMFLLTVLLSFSVPWWPLFGDCGGRPLLNDQGRPNGTDFTARIVFVPPMMLALRPSGSSLWAIARVEKRFSDSDTRVPTYIILRGLFKPGNESEQYFVEGRRSRKLLTKFLPVIEPIWCGHTKVLDYAALELRILRNDPSKAGPRIIGIVSKGYRFDAPAVSGILVIIKGPNGIIELVTDDQGIFDKEGLPPGKYTVQLATEKTSETYTYDIKERQVTEARFTVR